MTSTLPDVLNGKNSFRKRLFLLLLISLLATDLSYSYLQYATTPFDGDMAGGIVPHYDVKHILDSPLGFKALSGEVNYSNPNRYFSHSIFYTYFNTMPLWLHSFMSPLDSAYIACAISKLIIHIGFLLILNLYIFGSFNLKKPIGWLSMLLISSFFQTRGFQSSMGIIDQSTTYVFFYALPTLLLLVYLLPFWFLIAFKKNWKSFHYLKWFWPVLAVICSLSGPLNPGISLVLCVLYYSYTTFVKRGLHKDCKIKALNPIHWVLVPLALFSVYSLYLGTYNLVDQTQPTIPLVERYCNLSIGMVKLLFTKVGYFILFISITINLYFLRKTNPKAFNEFRFNLLLAIVFCVLYLLLLPLGGYRIYRPLIVRYDTFIPITLIIFYFLGATTIALLATIETRHITILGTFIGFILIFFTIADQPEFDKNACQKNEITNLILSNQEITKLSPDCKVMDWNIIENPENSRLHSDLLVTWKILPQTKLFYQSNQP